MNLPSRNAPPIDPSSWTTVGLRHGETTLAEREPHALDAAAQLALLHFARAERLGPLLLLATCNRLELHAPAASLPRLLGAWHELSGGDSAAFDRLAFRVRGLAAVRRLLRVATGLDSQLVGESGIRCQLQAAHARSVACGVADAWLNRLVQDALAARRSVHAALGLTGPTVSHATLAEAFIAALPGADAGRRAVLVVGAGHLAQNAARRLSRRIGGRLVLLASDPDRAREALAGRDIDVRPMCDLAELAARFDVIVTAASGSHVLRPEHLGHGRDEGAAMRPRWIVDLGAPRNCDPSLAHVPGVDLVDVESLPRRMNTVPAAHIDMDVAEAVLDARLAEFVSWHERRSAILASARTARTGTLAWHAMATDAPAAAPSPA